MGRKTTPVSEAELSRAREICAAAIAAEGGLGIHTRCASLSAAMHLRQLVYRARQYIRRQDPNSNDPVSTVDMRIVDNEDGTYDLKIFPPGQFVKDHNFFSNASNKPLWLADTEAENVGERGILASVGVETVQDWIAGILKETLAKPVREAIRRADLSVRDAYLLDWEDLARLLYESGIRATKEPKFYSDPSPPPLTQERHR